MAIRSYNREVIRIGEYRIRNAYREGIALECRAPAIGFKATGRSLHDPQRRLP
jgi:hypothetical protein